jgi:3-oxoadipate enol-lactonase
MSFDYLAHRTRADDGRLIDTGRVKLWCHDTGGDGEPLFLLDGFTTGHFGYDFARPYLRDYRVITWTPRGLGPSERPDPARHEYSVEVWAEDLRELLQAIGVERTHIWAAGFGCYIGFRFVADNPELVGALVTYTDVWAGDPTKRYPAIWAVYKAIVENFGTTGFGARMITGLFHVPDLPWWRDWEALNVEFLLHEDTVEATVGYCLTEVDVRDALPHVRVPTLVLQGDVSWDGRHLDVSEDHSLAFLREQIPHLEVAIVEGTHPGGLPMQRPEEYARVVREFLSRHPLQ